LLDFVGHFFLQSPFKMNRQPVQVTLKPEYALKRVNGEFKMLDGIEFYVQEIKVV
jgi:hypothetical protein